MELHVGTVIAICTAIGGLVTFVYYVQAVLKNFRHDKEAFKAEILQEAKQEIEKFKLESTARREVLYNQLDNKIDALDQHLESHKSDVSKDLMHIRETYNGEIRNLGEKIEGLRRELRDQHGQLVGLLSEMIKKAD